MFRIRKAAARGGVLAVVAIAAALLYSATGSAATHTYHVNSTADDGSTAAQDHCTASEAGCTLRAAIDLANANSNDDNTIVVDPGVYKLDGPAGDDANKSGDLDVAGGDGTLTIKGADLRTTVIDAQGNDRVLDIGTGFGTCFCINDVRNLQKGPLATVDVSGVTLRNGFTGGTGPDLATGDATVSDALKIAQATPLPFANSYDGGGARIGFGSKVSFTDSSVSFNRAGSAEGFLSLYGPGGVGGILGGLDSLGNGGGIFNAGDLTLTRTTVHRDISGLLGGGIASLGSLHVNDSTLDENVVTVGGGGVFNAGLMDVAGTTFSGNSSGIVAGGLLNLTPASELVPIGFGTTTSTTDTTTDTTTTTTGGNTPPSNTIVNSTFNDNLGRLLVGGAIASAGGNLDVSSSTIADDEMASTILGRLIGPGAPLGIDSRGAGLLAAGPGDINVKSSIVATNIDDGITSNCGGLGGDINSLGHNIESGEDCGFSDVTDQQDVQNPLLDKLANYGGPTETRALLPGSAALDKGGSDCPATDQRGGHRPPPAGSPGDACDVGAFEAYSLGDLSIASIDANPDPQSLGGNVTYNVVANNDGPDAINLASITNPLPADTTFVSGSPGCAEAAGVVTCGLGTMNAQQVKIVKITVHPGHTGNYTDAATIGAPGITDTNSSNDSASVQNAVLTAAQQQVLGEQVTGFQGMGLVLKAPKTVTLSQFLNGFNVQAYCTKEQCLRHLREHASINSGVVRIAGYNLAVFRGTLALTSSRRTIKLVPCVSGSGHSHPNRRCHANLARAAGKFAPFKLKVVVAAVDRNGHKAYAKRFLRVKP